MSDPTTPHKVRFEDGFRESWSRQDGPKAEVTYDCAWEDRYALIRELIGGFSATATGFGSWVAPHAFPPSPNMVALAIAGIEGLGAAKPGSKWSPYGVARLTVQYGVPTFALDDNDDRGRVSPDDPSIPGVDISIKGTSSFRTLPEGKLIYSGTPQIVTSEVGVPEPVEEISLTFSSIPVNPYPWIYPYIGTINHLPIFGHMRGEVLLESVEVSASGNAFSTTDMTAKLNFLSRVSVAKLYVSTAQARVTRDALDWNKLADSTGVYKFIEYRQGGARVFQYSNFWEIFMGAPDGVITYYST